MANDLKASQSFFLHLCKSIEVFLSFAFGVTEPLHHTYDRTWHDNLLMRDVRFFVGSNWFLAENRSVNKISSIHQSLIKIGISNISEAHLAHDNV